MTLARAGFIGLGHMGGGMAGNLLRGGVPLTVYDSRAEAMAGLVAQGARAAASPADVAAAVERVFLCLPFAPEVREVLFAEHGIAAGAAAGLPLVDCTTLLHADARDIAAQAARTGLRYHDCPISGGPAGAEAGTLTIMFGGDRREFEAARPYLEMMGRELVYCGELGAGQLMKAINNVIYDINIAAFCELLPLAMQAGLDPRTVASVVTSGSSRSFASERFVPRILERRFDGDFAMAAAWKDIVNVQRLAVEHEAMTPVLNAMTSIYQSAIAQGHGKQAKSAMIKLYEQVLGVEFRGS